MASDPPDAGPFRLLFVCTGNTCRSPMAEAIARSRAAALGWSHLEVASAGAGAVPGAPASEGAVRVGRAHGLDLSGHRASLLTAAEVERADLILTMAASHLMRVIDLGGGERAALLASFAGDERTGSLSIPDPVGGPDEEYEATYQRLSELIDNVLKRLEPVLAP